MSIEIPEQPVKSIHQNWQQPLPLVACGALANLSLACQTLGNVARDHYLISPVSLYFLVVASSGERKSAADNVFSKAIRQWEMSMRKKREPHINESFHIESRIFTDIKQAMDK